MLYAALCLHFNQYLISRVTVTDFGNEWRRAGLKTFLLFWILECRLYQSVEMRKSRVISNSHWITLCLWWSRLWSVLVWFSNDVPKCTSYAVHTILSGRRLWCRPTQTVSVSLGGPFEFLSPSLWKGCRVGLVKFTLGCWSGAFALFLRSFDRIRIENEPFEGLENAH
jgi:hypothetical protein